ncbi:hypothetical protein ACT4US_26610, partial [Bacillus sp. HC-Mk]
LRLKYMLSFQVLEYALTILILIIAAKMLLSVIHIEVSHTLFFIILVVAFGATFILHYMKNSGQAKEEVAATKEDNK